MCTPPPTTQINTDVNGTCAGDDLGNLVDNLINERSTKEVCLSIEQKLEQLITLLKKPLLESGTATEVESQLLPSRLTEGIIEEIFTMSHNVSTFGKKLVFRLYKKEDHLGHNCYGKIFNTGSLAKKPLNPIILDSIKQAVYLKFPTIVSDKFKVWKGCVDAINKALLREFKAFETKKD